MSNTKLILTDADGVLLDWEHAFGRWMEGKGFKKPEWTVADYSLAKCWNLPEWVIDHLVREFNESSNVAFIKAWGESGHYVKRLAERGYRFAVCTSFGGNSSSRALRRFNLENLFGEVFDDIEIIELGGDKTPFLSNYKGSELWWLEDNLNNAKKGLEVGLRSILVRHPHNADYDGEDMLVADSWREIYTIITGEKGHVD